MAYRFPLYYDRSNGSLKNMTQAQLAEIVNAVRYEWGASPYPGLGVVKQERDFLCHTSEHSR